jgi:hypothetical protein
MKASPCAASLSQSLVNFKFTKPRLDIRGGGAEIHVRSGGEMTSVVRMVRGEFRSTEWGSKNKKQKMSASPRAAHPVDEALMHGTW